MPGSLLFVKPVGSGIWDEASSPAVACSQVVSMLVYKGSLSDERGTFVSLVMIQTLNPYLGRALRRGVDVPASALGWVHRPLLISPHDRRTRCVYPRAFEGNHRVFLFLFLFVFFFFLFACVPPRPHVLACRKQQRGALINSSKERTCSIWCVPETETVLSVYLSDTNGNTLHKY